MTDNTTAVEKRIVEQLNFDAKTARRVGWEAWEFAIVGPHQVEVTNAAYGFLKDDHSYVVGIEKGGGYPVPAECECPADVHREPDCKHKVALATVGGQTVLNAAMECTETPTPFSVESAESAPSDAERLQPDGGTSTDEDTSACVNENAHCDGPEGEEFPCFDCFEVDQ